LRFRGFLCFVFGGF